MVTLSNKYTYITFLSRRYYQAERISGLLINITPGNRVKFLKTKVSFSLVLLLGSVHSKRKAGPAEQIARGLWHEICNKPNDPRD